MQVPEDIANLAGPPAGAPPSISIGGGGGPGPVPGGPGPGGLPPELMAALAGGGPDQGGPGEESQEAPSSPVDILAQMRDLGLQYMDVEPDDIDKQTMASILKELQSLFAKDQKENEAAQGTTPAMKGMAKAVMGR